MTSQLITTPFSAVPSAWEDRKASKDSNNPTADQFAAMLAAVCTSPLQEPGPPQLVDPEEATGPEGITLAALYPAPSKEPGPPQFVNPDETILPERTPRLRIADYDSGLVNPNPVFIAGCSSVNPDPVFALSSLQPATEGAQAVGKEIQPDVALPLFFSEKGTKAAQPAMVQTAIEGAQPVKQDPSLPEVALPIDPSGNSESAKKAAQPDVKDLPLVEGASRPSGVRSIGAVVQPLVKDVASPKVALPFSAAGDLRTTKPVSQPPIKNDVPPKLALPFSTSDDLRTTKDAAPPVVKELPIVEVPSSTLAPVETNPVEQPAITPTSKTIDPAANIYLVEPTQAAEGKALPALKTPALDASRAPNAPVARHAGLAEQSLQAEAARRDANMVASYLAENTRPDREANSVPTVKTILAGNGFDLHEDESKPNPLLNSRLQFSAVVPEAGSPVTTSDFRSNVIANSIQAQAISQIVAHAETLSGTEVRSLHMQLRPAELGQVDIQLSRDAHGRISAHISAEREGAGKILAQSLDQLREVLSRSGLDVDKLQVQVGTGSNDQPRSATPERRASPNTNSIIANETEPGGEPPVDTEKLLSIRA